MTRLTKILIVDTAVWLSDQLYVILLLPCTFSAYECYFIRICLALAKKTHVFLVGRANVSVIFCMQEVRYHFSRMEYGKGLLLSIFLVAATTLLLRCILFPINQIVWSNSILALTLNSFQQTLMDVPRLGPWLKFHIMALKPELKMERQMRRNLSQHHSTFLIAREMYLSFHLFFHLFAGSSLTYKLIDEQL